ncbi:MAG: DUF1553 domain-containing protein [Planctomycetota bacterium]|nr:DUF1553 domain-containing protein [Planctomycetota bacterium]
MSRYLLAIFSVSALLVSSLAGPVVAADSVDSVLQAENLALSAGHAPLAVVDDLAFLRRASVDLTGRIPARTQVDEFLSWPASQRRVKLIDQLLVGERFADRWTVFFSDLLRLRSNVTGGSALTAYVHQAIQQDMPYNQLVRRLIATNGKANNTPEVGFVLGDNADPYALASVTAQVFMGVRIGCAQCHDHPFDVWTRKDFYGMAAYFGKTRRVESTLTRVVYTTESNQTTVLWPPEGETEDVDRKPMRPQFPFEMIAAGKQLAFIERFQQAVAARQKQRGPAGPSVDDLLAATAEKARQRTRAAGTPELDVAAEAKSTLRQIDVKGSLYRHSALRDQLGELVTSPRNRLFAQSFVNRVWKELVGRGFVEPVDDFRTDNQPSHPRTLDFLAEEFVAHGYRFRHLVRMIVSSQAYQRSHVAADTDDLVREELESAFWATTPRRMMSESLYDSIVVAGHLFDYKYPDGQNKRVVTETVRVLVEPASPKVPEVTDGPLNEQPLGEREMRPEATAPAGYALEDAIELDFKALLSKQDDVNIERMRVMSKEELEAQRMMMAERAKRPVSGKYENRLVKREYDDNPKFSSAFRMASPAPAGHFLRVFGQTARNELGEQRDPDPTMRQALMMLNGRLAHEASRVGSLEPMHDLIAQGKFEQAVELAYLEILTRKVTAEEMADAKELLQAAATPFQGIGDLRWVLLNCNEFRFLP